MRFGAVAGIPAAPEPLPDPDSLSDLNFDTPLLEVAEGNNSDIASDHHVVPGECGPSGIDPSALSHRIAERTQTTVGRVICRGVVDCRNSASDRSEYVAAETYELLWLFRTKQRLESECGRPPGAIDRHEIDRVRTREPRGPVARHTIPRTVLDQPTTSERIGEHERFNCHFHRRRIPHSEEEAVKSMASQSLPPIVWCSTNN